MNLDDELAKKLPAHMMPGNVGLNDKVTWPFNFTVNFDFGANPVWSSSSSKQSFFQVTQDAGFLLCGISRDSSKFDSAGTLAPLGLDIRDRQSARQFNNSPIPLQMIGRSSKYTQFHEPLWINPSAFVDITVSSLLNTQTAVNTSTESKLSLNFFGYRMRTAKGANALGTTVGKGQTVQGFDHLGALRPANVGSQGSIMWPYFFTTGLPTATPDPIAILQPGGAVDTSFTVSQEAAFIVTSWIATVYERTGAGPYTYTALDPTAQSAEGGLAQGLSFTMQDPQSGRVYNFNPTPVDFLGQGDFPTVLASPQMLLPNSVFIVRYQNNHPTRVYVPFVTFFGYRVRLEDMQNIQSLTRG